MTMFDDPLERLAIDVADARDEIRFAEEFLASPERRSAGDLHLRNRLRLLRQSVRDLNLLGELTRDERLRFIAAELNLEDLLEIRLRRAAS